MESLAVEKYLAELRLVRKPKTADEARHILYEFLNYVDSRDIRGSVLRWLAACKARGNASRTLETKRVRVSAYYQTHGLELKIPHIRFTTRRPEIYSEAVLGAIFQAARGRRYWL